LWNFRAQNDTYPHPWARARTNRGRSKSCVLDGATWGGPNLCARHGRPTGARITLSPYHLSPAPCPAGYHHAAMFLSSLLSEYNEIVVHALSPETRS
jgi:hypothetical protein